jgi:rare lipoprotein A
MGRWFVILSLTVVQCSDAAMASSKSSDVPLWKRLISAFAPGSMPVPRKQARLAKAFATAKPQELVAESQARDPAAEPPASQLVAESQAQGPAASLEPNESIAGWQPREPIADWPGQQPVAGQQVRQLVADSQAQESQAHESMAGSQELARSNGTACSGGRRIISAFYSQGRRTASGQPFDPKAMAAAHRTLPFGTRLTVTNPRTGKSVIVVVNDRGPFVSGVSLDLTLGAARAIGMHGTGTVCIW